MEIHPPWPNHPPYKWGRIFSLSFLSFGSQKKTYNENIELEKNSRLVKVYSVLKSLKPYLFYTVLFSLVSQKYA